MPRGVDWLMEALFFDKQQSGRPARHVEEALRAPTTGLRQRSGTRSDAKESSRYTRAAMHLLTGAAVLAAGVAVAGLVGVALSRSRGG
jgi:hypothetical protein